MSKYILASVAGAVLLSTAPGYAQYHRTDIDEGEDYGETADRNLAGPFGFNLGAAVAVPLGDSSDVFDPGAGFAAGLTFYPHPLIGFQAEYLFSFNNVEGDALNIAGLEGDQTLQYGDLNIVVRPVRERHFGFYALGGPGIYHRHVELSQAEGVAVVPYCDPLLFVCVPTAVQASEVLGEAGSTDLGFNFGAGVYYVLTPPVRAYLEARYHHIWGPNFRTADGREVDADGDYLPIVLGLAF